MARGFYGLCREIKFVGKMERSRACGGYIYVLICCSTHIRQLLPWEGAAMARGFYGLCREIKFVGKMERSRVCGGYICVLICCSTHIRQLLSWEGVTMALAASAFAYYFGYGCRSQYSCGIDKAHLFKRVCKGAATRVIVTPEHGTTKNMDKIVFLCYYVNRNCEVEDYGCHKLYR